MIEHQNTRNPILPLNIHIPDGEAHVMPDGKLYIYGSYDTREYQYCCDQYRVVSTADMRNWVIHDTAFRGTDIPWDDCQQIEKTGVAYETRTTPFIKTALKEFFKGLSLPMLCNLTKNAFNKRRSVILYAPDCIYKDEKYYLYFCTDNNTEGVAVSCRPEGPFKDPVRLPCKGIDPAVFIDDDGKAFFYWGQFYGKGVPLNPDMCSFEESAIVDEIVTEEKHYFHEGSSIRKIGNTYYCVFADMERGRPTALGYATASAPLGPYTYRGIIVDNKDCDPKSWNNHGSIVKFQDDWYVCYHRCSRNSQRYRRLCMEKIRILENGTIPEVKMTSQGVGDPFVPGEKIFGYQACGLRGKAYIDTDTCYGEAVKNIRSGDEITFRYINSTQNYSSIELVMEGKGEIEVYMDDNLVGTVVITNEEKHTGRLQIKNHCKNEQGYELVLKCKRGKALSLKALTLC